MTYIAFGWVQQRSSGKVENDPPLSKPPYSVLSVPSLAGAARVERVTATQSVREIIDVGDVGAFSNRCHVSWEAI